MPTKVQIKTIVFPLVTYGCESWTMKKAELQRIDAFKLWSWRILLKVPWTARSHQSILREINPEYLLEGVMLKLQSFGHLTQTADSLEKSLMLGKTEQKKRVSEDEMVGRNHRCNGHELGQIWRWSVPRMLGVLRFMGLQRVGHERTKQTFLQRNT